MNETVFLDASFMDLLCQYVETNIDEVACLVAKFLNAFANDSSFIESYEVDNFILKNATVLSTWSVASLFVFSPWLNELSAPGVSMEYSNPTSRPPDQLCSCECSQWTPPPFMLSSTMHLLPTVHGKLGMYGAT